MLPTPPELREQSRLYREAAEWADGAAAKYQLAAYALALAQVAEAIEREGEFAPPREQVERYERLLARALDEESRGLVQRLLSRRQARADTQDRIKRWRMRAGELRTTADQFGAPSAQEAMRRAAADCDKLADDAEALLATRPPAPGDKAG